MTDTQVAPRVADSVTASLSNTERRWGGACASTWPGGKRAQVACNLRGTIVEKVSRSVQHKLGLPSTLITRVTIRSSGGQYSGAFSVSKAVNKAEKSRQWGSHEYPMTVTFTITSPVAFTRAETARGPKPIFDVHSWK